VKGLGAALQSKILQGIDIKRRGEGQRHLHRAATLLEAAEANLRRSHPKPATAAPRAIILAGYNSTNTSPTLKFFLSRLDRLISRCPTKPGSVSHEATSGGFVAAQRGFELGNAT
jgi:hypothetical protein